MFQWILVLFYVSIGPTLFTLNFPYKEPALGLSLVTFVAGLAVSRIHLNQRDTRGRLAVALGTLMGSVVGIGVCMVSLLMLAFASDSGEYADVLGKMMIGVTVLIFLVFPPLGALVGTSLAKVFGNKDKTPSSQDSP